MTSSTFILPSYFGTPFTTEIPSSQYDSKGRQLGFIETEVQRLERMALVNASKSRSSSPTQSRQPSFPPRKLIAQPYDPIEFMANHLAEKYMFDFSDDFSSLPEEKLRTLESTPKSFLVPTSRKSSSSNPSSFQHSHERKRGSLSSIREEEDQTTLTANTSFK